MLKHLVIAACAALSLVSVARAQTAAATPPAAVIEGVQMPAWVQRGQARTPVSPGMVLRSGDELRTGGQGKLLVRLAEGSSVKLGENGVLRLAELTPQPGLFRGALNVLEGAFRFTTDVAQRGRRRDMNITIRTVTAGIRGTDLWGKSTAEREIVCLIEGVVEVTPPGEATFRLDQPLQFYQREGGKSLPVALVSEVQLKQWAAETELDPGRGIARRGGRARVVAAVTDTQAAALAIYDQLRDAGYAAQIFPSREADRRTYEVRIGGLASRAEAEGLAARLRGRFGVSDPRAAG